MKTLLTALNLFCGIYIIVFLPKLIPEEIIEIKDMFLLILKFTLYSVVSIANLYHVLRFIKNK